MPTKDGPRPDERSPDERYEEELKTTTRDAALVAALLLFVRGVTRPFEAIEAEWPGEEPWATGAQVAYTTNLEAAGVAAKKAAAEHAPAVVGGYASLLSKQGATVLGTDVDAARNAMVTRAEGYITKAVANGREAAANAFGAIGQTPKGNEVWAAINALSQGAASYARTVGVAEPQLAYQDLVQRTVRAGSYPYVRRTAQSGACGRCASLAGVHRASSADLWYSHPSCCCVWEPLAALPLGESVVDSQPRGFTWPVHLDDSAIVELLDTVEMVPEAIEVISDSQGQPMRLKVLLTRANVRNGNRRIYPKQVLEDMVVRGQAKLAREMVAMEQDHPPVKKDGRGRILGFATDSRRNVAIIDRLYMVDDRVYVDVTMLETDYGKPIIAAIRAGKKPPVSLRSLGNTRRATVQGVPTDIATYLDWYGGDWVDNPALVDAGPEQVLTDAQLDEALLDSAKEAIDMNEIDKLKAELKALTDAKADASAIAAIQAQLKVLTDAEAKREADAKVVADAKAAADAKSLVDMQAELDAAKKEAEGKEKALFEAKKKLAEAEDAAGKKGVTDAAVAEQIAALKTVVDAQAAALKTIEDANKLAEAEKAKLEARGKVVAFVDSFDTNADLKRFSGEVRKAIADRVARAETVEAAEAVLTDAIKDADTMIAAAKLEGRGYQGAGGGGAPQGRTTSVKVTDNPKPYLAVLDKFNQAFDDHAKRANSPSIDRSIREANKPIIDQLVGEIIARDEKALTDSAEVMLDAEANGRSMQSLTDSTTSNLWNQPTLLLALMVQQFQTMEALQFVQGIGPAGFEQGAGAQGNIGSVLRVPAEYFTGPTGVDDMPYYSNFGVVGESADIPEITVSTRWMSFLPAWRRIAFNLTADAEKAMVNGPLSYDAWARHLFHLGGFKARLIDYALYEEMLLTSSEYNATAVATEAVGAGEWTYDAGGSVGGYGANVCGVAQLLCGGTAGSPNAAVPVVRPRALQDLNAAGEMSAVTYRNNITIATLGGVTQVLGYLNADGEIANISGTATYAVDYHNGKVLFKATATSGAADAVRPTISYSYETNFDTFDVTNPTLQPGETIAQYYSKLLQQVDTTGSNMGSHPRYMPPDMALMSLNVANYIQNAATFYKWVSPTGSMLKDPRLVSNSKFAERNGIEFAKINTPWSAGDRRILLTRHGSTKYGIETPWEIQGPYPKYNSSGMPIDAKAAYGREKSVIATPQVTDQNDVIRNPVSRSIILT